jgi:hypothetical protein
MGELHRPRKEKKNSNNAGTEGGNYPTTTLQTTHASFYKPQASWVQKRSSTRSLHRRRSGNFGYPQVILAIQQTNVPVLLNFLNILHLSK